MGGVWGSRGVSGVWGIRVGQGYLPGSSALFVEDCLPGLLWWGGGVGEWS